jgi:hypothetical protein
VNDKDCNLFFDRKYWINMVSTTMVEKLRLSVIELRRPYIIASLEDSEFKDMPNYLVTKQVRVSFTIGGYKDEVLCDVLPYKTRDFLLGRPWRYNRQAKYDPYHLYQFIVGFLHFEHLILTNLKISLRLSDMLVSIIRESESPKPILQ